MKKELKDLKPMERIEYKLDAAKIDRSSNWTYLLGALVTMFCAIVGLLIAIKTGENYSGRRIVIFGIIIMAVTLLFWIISDTIYRHKLNEKYGVTTE
jgi:predicted membrane channel-forming protein YqfA (hemolysin III family)